MILDYIDQFQIDGSEVSKLTNELDTLLTLKIGLQYLSGQVRKFETSTTSKNQNTFALGNVPANDAVLLGIPANSPKELIICAFHWYSITACNYMRLVGWICGKKDKFNDQYLESVDNAMYIWRNKGFRRKNRLLMLSYS